MVLAENLCEGVHAQVASQGEGEGTAGEGVLGILGHGPLRGLELHIFVATTPSTSAAVSSQML